MLLRANRGSTNDVCSCVRRRTRLVARRVAGVAVAVVLTGCTHSSDGAAGRSTPVPVGSETARLPEVIHAAHGPAIPIPPIARRAPRRAHRPEAATLKRLSGMPFATRPVVTSHGREAATWTSNTDAAIAVWRQTSSGWVLAGRTTYPTNPQLPHCRPDVSGAAIIGAHDAVFNVENCFAGDGSVNAAAIGDGPHGWGPLQQPRAHRLLSTGEGGHNFRPQSAVHWGIEFDNRRLVTIDNGGWFGKGGALTYPRIQLWRWRHGGLTSIADSVVRSKPGAPPDLTAAALPSDGCPRSGTYVASFGVLLHRTRHPVPNAPIAVEVFPRQVGYPAVAHCTEYVSPLMPIDVEAGRTSTSLISASYKNIVNRRWITGPAWLLIGQGSRSADAAVLPDQAPQTLVRRTGSEGEPPTDRHRHPEETKRGAGPRPIRLWNGHVPVLPACLPCRRRRPADTRTLTVERPFDAAVVMVNEARAVVRPSCAGPRPAEERGRGLGRSRRRGPRRSPLRVRLR